MARPLATVTAVESKLFLRDPAAVFFGLAFPTVLLAGLSLIYPGFTDVDPSASAELAGLRAVDLYLPIVIALGIATVSLTTLPAFLADYRERGVLRRLATTPARPVWLLLAQVMVNLGVLVVAVAVVTSLGAFVFDVPLPESPLLALLVFVLGTVATMGVGLLVAAVARTARAASGIGMLVYFPLLLLAGVWLPTALMPDLLARISELSPLGAASQALTAAWFGDPVSTLQLAVMAGWAVVLVPLAARLSRWT